MSLFNYTNPSGAGDQFPFPTDGQRKIYFQEINNMFEQVRQHLNGNIGPANFEQPFSSALDWNLGAGSQAITITSASAVAAIAMTHQVTPLSANVGAVQFISSAASPSTTSIIRSYVNSTSSDSWPIHLVTDKASGDIAGIKFGSNVPVDFWTLVRASDAKIKQNVPSGSGYDFHINAVSQLSIDATDITTPLNLDALSYTAGNTVLQDGSLSFGDTADLTKEGTDTVVVGEKLRIKDGNGPLLQSDSAQTNTLVVEDRLRFETTGPYLLGNNESLSIRNAAFTNNKSLITAPEATNGVEIATARITAGGIITTGLGVSGVTLPDASTLEITLAGQFAEIYSVQVTLDNDQFVVVDDTGTPGVGDGSGPDLAVVRAEIATSNVVRARFWTRSDYASPGNQWYTTTTHGVFVTIVGRRS